LGSTIRHAAPMQRRAQARAETRGRPSDEGRMALLHSELTHARERAAMAPGLTQAGGTSGVVGRGPGVRHCRYVRKGTPQLADEQAAALFGAGRGWSDSSVCATIIARQDKAGD